MSTALDSEHDSDPGHEDEHEPAGPDRVGEATILLVEDSPADAELAVIAIQQTRPDVRVEVVATGEAALAFLERRDDHAEAPVPELVLLDLNLPGRDGTEILERIKADERLRPIPVIVFSNSNADDDIAAAYRAQANAYLLKPMEYAEIKDALADLLTFWLDRVRLHA